MESRAGQGSQRLESVVALARSARATFLRFPLALLSAVSAAALAHHLANIDFETALGADAFVPVLMVAILGISLFTALTVIGESRGWTGRKQSIAAVAGLLALFIYYMLLPSPIKGGDLFRYAQLLAATHLLVSFGAFVAGGGQSGFWQFNWALFLRIALAVLYSSVLYLGLVLALAACDALLGFDIEPELYLQLWFWVVFVYNTWFFLAGVPENLHALEARRDYPAGLRIFTQYVLIPLVVVYLVILYAYMGKIIVEWELPKGWVGYPVIGVAVTGMLALLLVHPIRQRAENAWIATYSKYFHWSLFPLIVLIAVAIATRIGDYGVTENRYAVVVLTGWLLAIALYFSVRSRRDIRVIPVSLCAVVALTALGPGSATAVSRRSQVARLDAMLGEQNVRVDGVLDRSDKSIDFEREKEISNIVKYLSDHHGLETIRGWYAEPDRLPDGASYHTAMQEMGLSYIPTWVDEPEGFHVGSSLPNPLDVQGFDHQYRAVCNWRDSVATFRATIAPDIRLSIQGTVLRLERLADDGDALQADFASLIRDLIARDEERRAVKPTDARLELENDAFRVTAYIEKAEGRLSGDTVNLRELSATLLIDQKR